MPKPRVILVNRVYWPSTAATAQLLTDLGEGLASRGWTVHVIAAGESSTRRNGVTIHRNGGTDRHAGMIARLINYRAFRGFAERQLANLLQPGDVVVAMTDPPMIGAALARVVASHGAKMIHWVQDIYPEIAATHFGPGAGALLAPFRSRRDTAWQTAHCCVTLGEDMARTVASRGVSAASIALIPNWAPRELDQPAAPAAIESRRAAWGLTDKFVVTYSGNLGRVHEFKAVLAAAERLRERTDMVFLFIGQGARFDEVRAAARERLPNVRLLPPEPREHLAASLAAADVQLVTLKPEFAALVYPSKLAGVLAAGRPVMFIGPSQSEIARLIAREQCGQAFAPDAAADLADELIRLATAPDRVQAAGRRARAVYDGHFTFNAALMRWESLLTSGAHS